MKLNDRLARKDKGMSLKIDFCLTPNGQQESKVHVNKIVTSFFSISLDFEIMTHSVMNVILPWLLTERDITIKRDVSMDRQ